MDPDFAQRRRVFVAVAITAVAVPSAFLFGRDTSNAGTSPQGTLVGTVPPAGAPATPSPHVPTPGLSIDDQVLGTTPTGYLDGTVPPGDDAPPIIAIPRPRDTLTGEATFTDGIPDPASCIIPQAPNGATVTLTNLDNSHSVKCQVVAIAGDWPADVLLHPDAFARIADITEAPVPVEITW